MSRPRTYFITSKLSTLTVNNLFWYRKFDDANEKSGIVVSTLTMYGLSKSSSFATKINGPIISDDVTPDHPKFGEWPVSIKTAFGLHNPCENLENTKTASAC